MLTPERLKEVLRYNPETGIFFWIQSRRVTSLWSVAGTRHDRGYIMIRIDSVRYYAHRLAWLYTYGAWPDTELDHRDGDHGNNRIKNLRPSDSSQNNFNLPIMSRNTSGFKGVDFHMAAGRWRARITVRGEHHHLGLFDTAEQAAAAREAASIIHHGEFRRQA